MRVERYTEPAAFFEHVAPFLEAREAEHNLILGFRSRLEADRHAFGQHDPLLYAVFDRAASVVGVATQTPPHGLVLSEMENAAAVDAVAEALLADGAELPTVLGPVELSRRFAERWAGVRGLTSRVGLRHRIYEATEVVVPVGISGCMRPYTEGDRLVVLRWLRDFITEAASGADVREPEQALEGRTFYLWQHGCAVSLAGYGAPTPNGIRVGPVYTPPEFRRRGYASALTAALTSMLLEQRRFCFLFTDLANATSNSIYQQVGYRPVTDVTVWSFSSS
jgi:predicted GNAT family acetyltransferase